MRGKLSAEIHSLVRAQITPQDNVLLLSTDTDDGEVCARLVEHYLHDRMGMPPDRVKLKRIKGLQVDDASTFRKTGVVGYIKAITDEIQKRGAENVVLNPTGGYKVLIPYSTIMAMINGLRAIYIFDNGKALLSLPRLPLEFENSRLESLLPAMDLIQSDTAILESDFWGSMPHHDRQELRDVLLENAGHGMVTLSAVGLLVHEGLIASRSPSLVRVFLSRQAIDDLVDAPKDWNALGFLQQIEHHLVSQIKLHKLSDGTDWLKPGNTDDRYRVELNGRDMLVYRILPHDEYEKCVGKL